MTLSKRYEKILSFLDNNRVSYEIDYNHPHPRLVFDAGFYVLPNSSSDHRGMQNAISEIRRMLKIERPEKRHRERKRRNKVERPVECPTSLTPGRDVWAVLKQLKV